MADDQANVSAIRSIAVTGEDVVNAFIYTRENPGRGVVRIVPPFHGRMRARLHVYQLDDSPDTGAIHIEPKRLLEPDVVASYPSLERIEASYRDERGIESGADGETGTDHEPGLDPERLRKRHADAIDSWRDDARTSIVSTITLEGTDGSHSVAVSVLG